MSGDSMNLEESAQAAREIEQRALDARIVQQLEMTPEITAAIPADFAVRVAAKVPARRRPVAVRTTHYGRTLMAISLVVLFVALLVLAARGSVSSLLGSVIEWTLCIEFLAITVWMGVERWRSN